MQFNNNKNKQFHIKSYSRDYNIFQMLLKQFPINLMFGDFGESLI